MSLFYLSREAQPAICDLSAQLSAMLSAPPLKDATRRRAQSRMRFISEPLEPIQRASLWM
jgi:hypothetical protein